MKCWICGVEASTGEHKIKKSDLISIFGHVSLRHQLYLHNISNRNIPVKGLTVGILKSGGRLCAMCNNQRTQPFDRSWTILSDALRAKGTLRPGGHIDLGRIFPGSTRKSMLNVHLYFVKLFGCVIAEKSLPIEIGGFSQAILDSTPHPKIHLAISPMNYGLDFAAAGYSDMSTSQVDGTILYATWLLTLDRFSVRVIYSDPSEHRKGSVDSWHPASIKNFYG